MAVFADLPQETIARIIELAYDDEDETYLNLLKRGLCRASLVHSSFRRPAQELLTTQLVFDHRNTACVPKFMAKGPQGWKSRRVVFEGMSNQQMVQVLSRAAEGGVRSIKLGPAAKGFDLFGLAPLDSKLMAEEQLVWLNYALNLSPSPLLICADLEALDAHWSSLDDSLIWPEDLRHLRLNLSLAGIQPFGPLGLFAGSAATLRSLRLLIETEDQLNLLADLAPELTNLNTLSLQPPRPRWQDATPALTASLVAALPSLTSLSLVLVRPDFLAQAVAAVKPGQLHRLSCDLQLPELQDEPELEDVEGLVADMQAAAASAAWVESGARWEVGLWHNVDHLKPFDEGEWTEVLNVFGQAEEWDAARTTFEAEKGGQWVFKPLDERVYEDGLW